MVGFRATVRVLVGGVLITLTSVAVQAQPDVVRPAPPPAPTQLLRPEADVAAWSRYVEIDVAGLAEATRQARPEVTLELVPGEPVRSMAERIEYRGPGRFTWSGGIEGDLLGHVLLTVEGTVVVGRVVAGGRTYGIGYAGAGRHVVYEVDPAAFPEECGTVEEFAQPEPWKQIHPAPEPGERTSPDTISVMVLYTQEVAAALGEGAPAFLQGLIDTMNDVLTRTGLSERIRLVQAREVFYPETGSTRFALSQLAAARDGVLDEVHGWRMRESADLVALLTERGDYCGYALIPTAIEQASYKTGFSVTKRSCAHVLLNFAHELGHNLGLRHDTYVDPVQIPFPYGHGFVNVAPTAGEPFRTVMAYDAACGSAGVTCPSIPYFSNAALTLNGDALGEPEFSDAARALAVSMPVVASYFRSYRGHAPTLELTTHEEVSVLITSPLDSTGASASFQYVSDPLHGTLLFLSPRQVLYSPDTDFFGTDSLTYRLLHEPGVWSEGRIVIEVLNVNDPPLPVTITAPPGSPPIVIEPDSTRTLRIAWTPPRDPDGPTEFAITWHLKDALHRLLMKVEAGNSRNLDISYVDLHDLLVRMGVEEGDVVYLYHYVTVSDGIASTPSGSANLWLRRAGGEDHEGEEVPGEGEEESEEEGEEEESEEEESEEGTEDLGEGESEVPVVPVLQAVYPNPVRGAATLTVGVPESADIAVTLYDVLGQEVYTKAEQVAAGYSRLDLGLWGLPAGLYLYQVMIETTGESSTFTGKLTILR